jgi:lipid-A-disaccharide synthase
VQKIFIIAGEESGDQLGAAMLEELKTRYPHLKIRGIGGARMMASGLNESFFPMSELSLMGIAEILPHIPKLLRRIDQTVEAIRVFDPDIVLTIDAPDFCHRVQKKLHAEHIRAKRIHMVAPTVWAWRPKRAEKIARFLNGLLCLYPFEPKFFESYSLPATFIGHPVMSMEGVKNANGNAFRFRHMIALDQKIVGLFFGSRKAELNAMAPLFIQAAQALKKSHPHIGFMCPTTTYLRPHVESLLKDANLDAHIVTDLHEKWDAFAACNYAVATSGTVGLELSVLNIPHIISYKMNALTWAFVSRMVTTRFAHLSNVICDQEIVPEILQDKATVENITTALTRLLNDTAVCELQKNNFTRIRESLTPPHGKTAAQTAADFIESL